MTRTKRRPITAEGHASDRMLTMQQAMNYLSEKGFPCRSRITFYRVLEDFDIKFTNINPHGTNQVRRFALSALQEFLVKQGLEP